MSLYLESASADIVLFQPSNSFGGAGAGFTPPEIQQGIISHSSERHREQTTMSNPLHEAAAAGDLDTVRALIVPADLDRFDAGERTPLMLAVAKGQTSIVRYLLEHGASPDLETSSGTTALTAAIRGGRTEIIRLLLERGADVNHVNTIRPSHETLLQIALFSKSREIVGLLIEAGADLNYRDEQGATPLHFAAEHARTFVVTDMIALGMDINARDNEGNTPLTVAARRSYTDIVALLLAAGTQESVGPDAPKIGALAHAALNKHTKLFKMLLEARGLPEKPHPFVLMFARRNPEIAALLSSFQ